MLDGAAFKRVLGTGCQAPNQKCERDRYKRLLAEAVRGAGVVPVLGGIEYAEDLVAEMDIAVARGDRSFDQFLSALHDVFRAWGR
jgi:endonuclease YncB( thermonuclease family)